MIVDSSETTGTLSLSACSTSEEILTLFLELNLLINMSLHRLMEAVLPLLSLYMFFNSPSLSYFVVRVIISKLEEIRIRIARNIDAKSVILITKLPSFEHGIHTRSVS